jgi:hypothetical protein
MIAIHRRLAPLLALILVIGSTVVPVTARAADPVEIAWTASALEATTRVVPQFVDTMDGAVFIAGGLDGTLEGQTSLGSSDGFVARYDTAGNLIWARHVGTSGSDLLTSLVVTSSGIFVGGRTGSRVENGTFIEREGFVAFLNHSGDPIWRFAEMDPDQFPVRLAPMPGGGVIAGMTGWEDRPAPDTRRPLFYRHFLPNGTIAWEDELLGWWTDDVDVDATGFTVAGQRRRCRPNFQVICACGNSHRPVRRSGQRGSASSRSMGPQASGQTMSGSSADSRATDRRSGRKH